MITLYGCIPAFGLPAASPFAIKMDVQLKMSGLAYGYGEGGVPGKGPKGKIPWIEMDGERIGDTSLIRTRLEERFAIDLDAGLSPRRRAEAWAAERMVEDHLYWGVLPERWLDDANFAAGPAHYFDRLPEDIRDHVRAERRAGVRAALHAQGLGRHTDEERTALAARSLASLAVLIGEKPYLMGDGTCGADATCFAMLLWTTAPLFPAPLQRMATENPVLRSYVGRMMEEFYPENIGALAV
jgi:glutathione S-transferase